MPRSLYLAPRRNPCGHAIALCLAWLCGSGLPAHLEAADCRAVLSREEGVDANVQPGDDFFRYANGGWLEATEIPVGKGQWGARGEIAERTKAQVSQLIDDAASAPRGSDARKVADFRAAFLDEAAIESRGIAPVRPLLERIDRLRDKTALTRVLGRELQADVDPMNLGVFNSAHVVGLAVQAGNHGETRHVAYLLQGGLGLPDREHYLSTEPAMQALRAERQSQIAQTLDRLAAAKTGPAANMAGRAEAVMALETAMARSHATRESSANDRNADNLWTRADFAREAPGMDWAVFFAAAGMARQPTFVAWQPSALKGTAALVASQPIEVWKDYLRVSAIGRYAEVLPRAFSAPRPAGWRAQRALEATQSAMSDRVAKMYVARHFPPEHKARVQAIVANVVAAFTRRVESATWMSPVSRQIALGKLRTLYFGVGYPETWPADASPATDAADAFGNAQRVEQRAYRRAVARLGTPIDRTEWSIAPQWPGAVLTFNENSYNFAAALLQAPKFDPAASEAANYGAIGAIVGHEVSHFVDTLGADYEADGRMRRWWTGDDLARYEAATEPLVRQFSAYRPFDDVAVDGKLGLTENVADLAGLAAAFDAHRETLGSRAEDRDFACRQDREFFIGYARGWRAKSRDESLRAQAASDHSPESYRVWTVRNLDAWYDAFDVRPGQRLYLDPAARVRIW